MQEQKNIPEKGKADGTKQDETKVLVLFERELVGVIRKGHGAISSKGQKEIEQLIEKYAIGD